MGTQSLRRFTPVPERRRDVERALEDTDVTRELTDTDVERDLIDTETTTRLVDTVVRRENVGDAVLTQTGRCRNVPGPQPQTGQPR